MVPPGQQWPRDGGLAIVTGVPCRKGQRAQPLEQNMSVPYPSQTLNSKEAAHSWLLTVTQCGPGLGTLPPLIQAAEVLNLGLPESSRICQL